MTGPWSLARRVFFAQLVVLTATFVALIVTIVLVAPGLFMYHLEMTGEDSPVVQLHAQEAFETSVGIALLAAAAVAVLAAVLLSWFVARRVSQPIVDLARAAEVVAAGQYDVEVPTGGFSREINSLSRAFAEMAGDLHETDEARGRLLADLAHEIRTPLSTLEAHIDGLEDGVVAAESRTFDTMRSQVQRLQRLATDVRLAADAQEHALDLQMQRVSVWELVRAAYDEAAPLYAEKGVRLENLCGDRSPVVHVDRDRMQQVLGNLLDNALRYTPTGGLVTISCRSTRSVIEVLVTDSGEGIPAEELERVFERFHRVEPSRQNRDGGSGLGLTIARAIVVDHGGGIRAHRDEAGMGTVVVVALPRG